MVTKVNVLRTYRQKSYQNDGAKTVKPPIDYANRFTQTLPLLLRTAEGTLLSCDRLPHQASLLVFICIRNTEWSVLIYCAVAANCGEKQEHINKYRFFFRCTIDSIILVVLVSEHYLILRLVLRAAGAAVRSGKLRDQSLASTKTPKRPAVLPLLHFCACSWEI